MPKHSRPLVTLQTLKICCKNYQRQTSTGMQIIFCHQDHHGVVMASKLI